jgi:hypothetical protein
LLCLQKPVATNKQCCTQYVICMINSVHVPVFLTKEMLSFT